MDGWELQLFFWEMIQHQQVQQQTRRMALVSNLVDCSIQIICRDRKRKKNTCLEFKETFATKVRRYQWNAAARVLVITQERNASFMTNVMMFYDDNVPSETQLFKEGSSVFPRRRRRVPVQWCQCGSTAKHCTAITKFNLLWGIGWTLFLKDNS